MKISDIQPNNNLNNVIQKIMRLWPIKLPTTMFHVTKKSNLESIKSHGIQTKRHGEVHGSMEIGPPSAAVYISIYPESNNLNTNLSGYELVSLELDTSFIDMKNIYIDDGFYAAFGNEQVFEDTESISDDLGIDGNEAEILLAYMEKLSDNEIVIKTRFLIGWYIKEHGELAVTQNIPPQAIKSVFTINNPFD